MCGICGIWGRPDREAVAAMVAALPHRGPDDRGIWADETVALGMTRLAILDLSDAGHQPMASEDEQVWIVYNGEVADFEAERERLVGRGHSFRSSTDTEVVLRLYLDEGEAMLGRLRGQFALAIYDRRDGPGRERLLLARDPFGIKPLLWADRGGALVFASELKALLAGGAVAAEIDPVALRLLLSYGSIGRDRSMLGGVRMLPPGHRMVVDRSGSRIERYWRLATDRRPELEGLPYEQLVAEVERSLEESLRLQLVSDVPLGAFLSGGLDSSLLVALMTRHARGRVQTFSVGFSAEGAAIDESRDAERTARHLGTDHHHVPVTGSEVREHMDRFVRGLDQPSVDGLNSYFVSWAARQSVTVAISGTGGDELFAGYPWFIDQILEERLLAERPLRSLLRSVVGRAAAHPLLDPLVGGGAGESLQRLRRGASFPARFGLRIAVFGPGDAARLLAPALRRPAGAGAAVHGDVAAQDELGAASPIQRISALTLRGYTVNQLLRDIDATSMAHSLEVRVPFLDPEVADVALALPDASKLYSPSRLARAGDSSYRATGAKRILVDVGRELLPPDMDAQPKRGFAMPFGAWLRGPLRELLDDTLGEQATARRGLLDPPTVARVRRDFLAGRSHWTRAWLLMVLELWCRAIIDGASGEVA